MHPLLTRRSLLLGTAGLTLAPWLRGVMRGAQAAAGAPPYALFFRVGNGTMENSRYKISNGIMENWYWPQTSKQMAPGTLTKQFLESRSYCSTSELAEYASRTIMVRGLYPHAYPSSGHNQCVQGLTGAGYWNPDPKAGQSHTECRPLTTPFANDGNCNSGWIAPRGESIDNLLARQLTPDNPVPLLLGLDYTRGGPISYALPVGELHSDGLPKFATSQPFSGTLAQAYRALFGDTTVDTLSREAMNGRRTSANDLAREQIKALQRNTRFSELDQQRLEQHLQNIRDVENTLQCGGIEGYPGALTALDAPNANPMARVSALAKMVALAVNCGRSRSIVICLGTSDSGGDLAYYPDALRPIVPQLDEYKNRSSAEQDNLININYHTLGHHVMTETDEANQPRMQEKLYAPLLSAVDRYRFAQFKEFLKALDSYQEEEGTLLDRGVSTFYADNMNSGHRIENLGYISVGSAGGKLATGQFIAAGSDIDTPYNNLMPNSSQDSDLADQYWTRMNGSQYVPIVKWLNTIGAAVGATGAAGQPLDDFNAANNGNVRGHIPGMLKS